MHALIIAQYFSPDIGGGSTRAYNSALALKMQGWDVTVVTAFPHYPHGNVPMKYNGKLMTLEEIKGLRVIRTWIPSIPHSSVRNRIILHSTFVLMSLFAMRYVRNLDIIFAMNPNLFSFYSAIIYRLIFRKKIIRNVDDLWPEVFYDLGIIKSSLVKRVLDVAAKISYQHSSCIIPVSAGYVTTLIHKYKIPIKKIVVIEHGVDLEKFQRKEEIHFQRKGKRIVMYSGALAEGYDFENVLQAAKILDEESIHFIIRGTGSMFNQIVNKMKEYRLTNVEVSNTLLSAEDLVSLLNNADMFILPMNSTGVIDQGLPTKILEYQALGKPIICVSQGEPGRYVLESHSGLVVEPKKPQALAQAILKLASDDALSKRLGKNGHTHVVNSLTFDKIGKRLVEVIKRFS